jgi:hypothetical protein
VRSRVDREESLKVGLASGSWSREGIDVIASGSLGSPLEEVDIED